MGKKKMFCPLRYGNIIADCIPYDYWRKQGKDRCCSFCGSWHPEEFLKFCDEVVRTNGRCGTVDLADSRVKFYMQRPGIRNAGDGAIKFKTAHLQGENADRDIERANKALRISNVIFRKKYSGEAGESEKTKSWLERWRKNG